MTLKEQIAQDMKTAMKAKDQVSLRALRSLKAAIMVVETSEGKAGQALSPDEEMQVLLKAVKQRRDSIDQYKHNGREDLAATESEELEVFERNLPKKLSPEELETKVKEIIDQVGATHMKDMGKVMGVASKELMGKADGKDISALVKKLLG